MAKITVQKISRLAKKVRRKHPNMKWTSAIKEASRMLKSGRKRIAGTKKKRKVAATLLLEKRETKRTKPKRIVRITRKKNGTFKTMKQVINGRKSVGAMPGYRDPDAAREIEIYADNNTQLYFSRRLPILKNLAKKYKKGTYNVELAAKLWRYYIEDAMQRYNKEHGSRGDHWSDLLSVADRKILALEYAEQTKAEFDLGNFPT